MKNIWLTSIKRKRHQREMNKLIRLLNKNIQEDNIWKGRFYVRQIAAQWYTYEDKSGADLWVVLQFIDKKTGFTYETAESVNHWRLWNGSHLWRAMNDFIVDKTNVWSEEPRPGAKEWYENITW